MYFIIYLKARDSIVEISKRTHFGDSCSDDLLKKNQTLNKHKLNLEENKN